MQSNSMEHIGPYADELSRLGHSCTIAVTTKNGEQYQTKKSPLYSLYTYDEILENKALCFPNSRVADIVHAWTPRENVRSFVETYQQQFGSSVLIVHLEDNEDSILESHYQVPIDRLRHPLPFDKEPDWNPLLCHPRRYREFLWQSDGVTTLAASLEKLLPATKPIQTILPIIGPKQFQPTLSPEETRTKFRLPADRKLIVYPGGVTSNNREDVRNLYLAIKTLNESGTPTILVKTGPSCPDLERSFAFPIAEIRVDLGIIDKADVTNLIYAADALVQPGVDSEFNRDRLPCKIPEFLTSGRPTIIPEIYRTLVSNDIDCCQFVDGGKPGLIAEACKTAFDNTKQAAEQGENAIAFAKLNFSAELNGAKLEAFYEEVKAGAARKKTPQLPTDESFRSRFLETRKSFKAAENEIVTLNRDIRRSQEEREQLLEKISDLDDAILRKEHKLERMRSTFSWKVTAPLRFLRRKLLDPIKSTPPPLEHIDSPDTPSQEHGNQPPEGHPCYHKDYYQFIQRETEEEANKLEKLQTRVSNLETKPTFSILLPTYNVAEVWLRRCIDSVTTQTYPHWELCIADDASTEPHVRRIIESYCEQDSRIKVTFRDQNGHISAASNSAFALATGDFIALLDHDDEIPKHALARVAVAIGEKPTAKLIYSDEDKIDEDGIRHDPHFKTDWNYEFFLGCNMISHFGIYHRDAFAGAGGFRTGYEGAQDWDLALRVVENCSPDEIVHIPEVLYHWRSIQGSTAAGLDQKNYAHPAQRKALESHIQRIGAKATVESVGAVNWRIVYEIPNPAPKISIIIPTRDQVEILQACVESILIKTAYPNYEIIIVDNDSTDPNTLFYLSHCQSEKRIKIIQSPGVFNFSKIVNQAILSTNSPLVCLLNNDTEVSDGSWLTEMVRHGLRDEVGVVGAKLLYPHDHVQHCGVIMGIYDIAGHAFKFLHKNDNGHIGRAKLVSRYSAVTGACMLFKKTIWKEIGGFDEQHLPISYNDLDFCLRSNEAGYLTILTPFATLYHKESESRGGDESDAAVLRFEQESEYMRTRWKDVIARDPFYNPNLTRDREDFSYRT